MPYRMTRKMTDKAVADFVQSYEDEPEGFRQALADQFGVSMRTVERRLPELVEQGVLNSKKDADGKTIAYEVAVLLGERRKGQRFEPHHRRDQELTELTVGLAKYAPKDPEYALELVEYYLPKDLPAEMVVTGLCDVVRRMYHGRPTPKVAEPEMTVTEKVACKARLDAMLSGLSVVKLHGVTEAKAEAEASRVEIEPVGDSRNVGAAFLARCLAND